MTEKQISRKQFIKGAGATIAGVAVTGALGGLLTGCQTQASADLTQPVQWPMKYTKLDPSVVEARAYTGYKEKGG